MTYFYVVGGLGAIRKRSTLVSAIKRARKSQVPTPPVPKSWEDMTIPPNLSTTVGGDAFLACEETLGGEVHDKIIIFCSNAQKDVMRGADYWMADGTFDVVSNTLFTQLFIITSISRTGITVPTLFAFLPNKETSSYQRCFQFLKDENIDPPTSLKTDFEKGIVRAFLNVYPDIDPWEP